MVRRTSSRDSGLSSGLVSSRVEMYESTRLPTKPSYHTQGRFSQEHQTRSPKRGQENKHAGSTLIATGLQHYAQGDLEKALKAFKTALSTQRVSLGNDYHTAIAHTQGNLGAVYLQQGDITKAKQELRDVIAVKTALVRDGEDDTNVVFARALNNLGNISSMAHNAEKGLAYYRESLQDLRRMQDVNKDIADVLYNIGRIQIQEKEWDAATSNLTEACRITKATYGRNHLFLAQTLSLIGFVQLSTESYDAALDSFLEAHTIITDIHGPDHTEVAASWYHIGMAGEARGALNEAWESLVKARDIFTRLGTEQNDPAFKTVRKSIARVEHNYSMSS